MSDLIQYQPNGTLEGWSQQAIALKETALVAAANIFAVRNQSQNLDACKAEIQIKDLIDQIDKARQQAKRPLLDECKRIEALAQTFVEELEQERARLQLLTSGYMNGEHQKFLDAAAKNQEKRAELGQQQQEQLAKAKTPEEAELIKADFDNRVASLPAPAINKAAGQQVKPEWDISVTSALNLANAYPECVKLTPLNGEIKRVLDALVLAGEKEPRIPGVRAKQVITSKMRKQRGTPEVVDV